MITQRDETDRRLIGWNDCAERCDRRL